MTKIYFDTKKFEKQLNKQLDLIVMNIKKEQQINKRKEKNSMFLILNANEESMLDVFLEKYNSSKDYEISGNCNEFPEHMRFSIKDTMNNLKLNNMISYYDLFINGEWNVILTPDSINYYSWKGGRIELFNELANSDKLLLKELIKIDHGGGNITDYLKEKLENDDQDKIRGIIGNLKNNGLLSTNWADNTIYFASLTHQGRTFFEREEEHNNRMKILNSPQTFNIGTINAQNSNVFLGDVIDSNVILNDTLTKIENDINQNCKSQVEKENLRELLNEAKEIIDDFKDSKQISTRKGFFKKLSSHLEKHGWFYSEIVGLFGQTMLMKISGQI